jgi:polysaccharide deacetylase family sporulation protein PdaB
VVIFFLYIHVYVSEKGVFALHMNLSAKKRILMYFLVCLVVTCGFDIDPTHRHERSYYESRGEIIWEVPMNEKLIALTFDDGPNPVTTPQILDLLKKYDAKVTFFVLGKQVDRFPDVVKRETKEGHEVANHTYNHICFNKNIRSDVITKEILRAEKSIQAVTGKKSPWFRPPQGHYNDLVVHSVKKNGYTVVMWSWHQDTKDWSSPGVHRIVNKVLRNARNGDIVLFHDYSTQTVEALKKILPELKKRGFRMVTISELLKHRRQHFKAKKSS